MTPSGFCVHIRTYREVHEQFRTMNYIAVTRRLRGRASGSHDDVLGDMNVSIRRAALARLRGPGREFMWITLGQAVAVIGSLVAVRVLTGLLSPAEYGLLALGMASASVVSQVVLGPLSGGTTRFFASAREAGDLSDYLHAVRRLTRDATILTLGVAALLAAGFALYGRGDLVAFTATACAFGLLSGYNSLLSGMQNAARQRAVVAFHQALEAWGRFLVAAALVVWLGATSTVAILGFIVAMLLVNASQLRFIARVIRSATASDQAAQSEPIGMDVWSKRILTYSWPFAIWGMFTWAQIASDRLALQVFGSADLVGLYAVLYQMGYYPIFMATGLLAQLMLPVMFQRAGDASNSERMNHVYRTSWYLTGVALALTFAAVLGAALLHSLIFRVFVAAQYASVAPLLPWAVLAGGLYAVGQAAVTGPLSQRESKVLIWPKVTCAVIGIGLNCVGAALFGVAGVVGAGVLFGAMYLIWIVAIVVRQHRDIAAAMRREVEAVQRFAGIT
jgi:O-antigen/teichoic acid export membrane protein